MDNAMDIIAELEKLRRTHLVVEEDCWYSCPKSGECCNSVQNETNCNCGADEHNKILDGIIECLKSPKTEKRFGCQFNNRFPISNYCALDDNDDKDHCHYATRLYGEGKPKINCEFWKEIE